jgi:hypothetical protein
MDILPQRFVKIRRCGIHNHTLKRHQNLQFVPDEKPELKELERRIDGPETKLQRLERLTGVNPCLCPECKTGTMIRIRVLPRIRSPGLLTHSQPISQSKSIPSILRIPQNRTSYALSSFKSL